jgi:hypothetical protein
VIIDGCTWHHCDWVLDEAVAKGVVLHWLPPHSSDETQPLDLGVFGLTRQALRRVRTNPEKTAQSNQWIRMLCAWHVAATPRNVIGRFRPAGLVVHWDAGQERLMARVKLAAADRAREVFLHETVEDETEDNVLSDDDRDDRLEGLG